MQKSNPAYQACLDEGLNQASSLIRQWCSRLLDTLSLQSMTISEGAERHPVNHAMVALMRNRMVIEHDFMAALKQAMADDAQLLGVKKTGAPLRSLSSLSFDDLELMGDDQVQETVERARLQQIVKLTCEAALSGFSARLSTVQGFSMVKVDSNPLRPDIVLQALLKVVGDLPVDAQVRSCLLMEGSQIMGDKLQALYLSLDAFLARQGVGPAAYSVVASPESLTGKTAPASEARMLQQEEQLSAREAFKAGNFPGENDSALARRRKLLTLDHLHHLLAGNYDPALQGRSSSFAPLAEEVVHPDFSPTLPAALDVLAELQEKSPGTLPGSKARPAPPLPVAQMRAHLKTESRSLGQSLAVEVVGLMIEQVTQDERLLTPVRQIIAHAEPAFLRLAVTDTRFFSDKSHPARKLLDTITNTSLAYASETAPGFAGFMKNLQALAPLLTEEHAGDAQHFATLLAEFERKQARNTPEYRQSQLRAVQALLQAEQRNLLAEKVAAQIRRRLDGLQSNRVIAAFLTGPWAQVLAREQLLAEEGDVQAQKAVFSRILVDLLWSMDLAQVAGQRQRLLQLIPGLLKALREGLLSIDYPLEQARAFFDELMALHQAGLRAQPDAAAVTPSPSAKRHALEKMFEADDTQPGMSAPWLAPAEAQHSGFMEDWEASIPGKDEPASAASGAAQLAPEQKVELQLGAWVEMLVDTQWLRAQLTWISPQNTLYMFTSEGGRKHSMTNRVLHHLLMLAFVKVVSEQGVLDRALDSVARTAMRNSMDGGDTVF
ncbi:MAG: DUF1631 domain-containing protein [Pseudomonadota bacterium]|nr:DUF1631 domain-containing protein [Pseudomonadota bacterium]